LLPDPAVAVEVGLGIVRGAAVVAQEHGEVGMINDPIAGDIAGADAGVHDPVAVVIGPNGEGVGGAGVLGDVVVLPGGNRRLPEVLLHFGRRRPNRSHDARIGCLGW